MNDVKIGNLIKFFSQNEEDGVKELGKFAKVIPPTKLGHNEFIRVIRVIDRLTA